MRVLLVDDNFAVRKMMIGLLTGIVDEFRECADGAHALAAYSSHRPDWVLIDILMAGVDGLTATRAIKCSFPEARIVVVTNYDHDDLRAAAREAGAAAYLLKDDVAGLREVLVSDHALGHGSV